MTRLQQAEQQLQDALRALESAVESVMTPGSGPGDRAALVNEIAAIEARLSEAMALIAAADNLDDGGGK